MEDKSIEGKKELLEYFEVKNITHKLKRWQKNLMKYLRNLFIKDERTREHFQKMEEQKQHYDEEVKKENDNFVKASKEIEQKKEKEINLIENNKNKIIEENNKKYENLIEYFESIKNDREKIIEFFNSNNLFEFNN